MIPVVTVVAFTLMGKNNDGMRPELTLPHVGIEGIADEIEKPFGTDPNDLPLGKHTTVQSPCL